MVLCSCCLAGRREMWFGHIERASVLTKQTQSRSELNQTQTKKKNRLANRCESYSHVLINDYLG